MRSQWILKTIGKVETKAHAVATTLQQIRHTPFLRLRQQSPRDPDLNIDLIDLEKQDPPVTL